MTPKPKILVPLALIKLTPESPLPVHFARETYIQKMAAHGLIPLFVSPATPQEDIDILYDEASGVLCMGGPDINPALYDAESHPKTAIDDSRRDQFELKLIQRALKDKKPFLGICRGCQMLNVASGGTLLQHLPDLFPNEDHNDSNSYDGMLNPKNGHALIIKPNTRAASFVKKAETSTSSAHHQAIGKLGTNLIISGTSPAGVVEIVEHADPNYFCFGIQSHPECCSAQETKRGDLEIFFSKFAEAALAFKKP